MRQSTQYGAIDEESLLTKNEPNRTSHDSDTTEKKKALYDEYNYGNDSTDSWNVYKLMRLLTMSCGVLLLCLFIWKYMTKEHTHISTTVFKNELEGVSLSVSNEYGALSTDVLPYSFLEESVFAETYKVNTITLNYTLPSGCIYHYYISGEDGFEMEEYTYFNYYDFLPTAPGQYQLSINVICDEVVVSSLSKTIWSKYIRRELSTLTDEDREIFLNAFATLWQVSTKEGIELYGDAYKSVKYFAAIHNDAGASPSCDEFHGSAGFVNNHVMLGAYLEQSLQLVDPRTCLHYMAYYYYFSTPMLDSRK